MKILFTDVSGTILDVKPDKRNECFNFGKDNAFPSLIEALINMSVTSKACTDRAAKAIYGGTFGEEGDVVVNSDGETLNEVLRIASREYSKHNNVFLQVGYDGNFDYKSIVVVPVTHVRIGKADDRGYSGKFIIYENWDKQKKRRIMSSEFMVVDRFSRNKEIAKSQVLAIPKEKGEGITAYNGQLIHIKKESAHTYSLSDLNPVMSEALLEHNSQTFRSRGALKGFLNTKVVATQPFANDKAREAFRENLLGVKGADNSSETVVFEATQQTDDLSKQIYIGDLTSKYNDKLFEYSDSRAEKNIAKAFTCPLILVTSSDSSIFGDSGALLREAKIQLWESRKEERSQLEEILSYIMEGFQDPVEDLEIINPYEEKVQEAKTED